MDMPPWAVHETPYLGTSITKRFSRRLNGGGAHCPTWMNSSHQTGPTAERGAGLFMHHPPVLLGGAPPPFFRGGPTGWAAPALPPLLGRDRFPPAGPAQFVNPLAPKRPHFPAKAKSVIYLFMAGGP